MSTVKEKEQATVPEVGQPEYWTELSECLKRARELLWARVQRGRYRDDGEAKAVMEAYCSVKKVLSIQERKMGQIPLLQEDAGEGRDGHCQVQ